MSNSLRRFTKSFWLQSIAHFLLLPSYLRAGAWLFFVLTNIIDFVCFQRIPIIALDVVRYQNNGTMYAVFVFGEFIIHRFCFFIGTSVVFIGTSVVISAVTSGDKTAIAIANSVNDFDFHNEMVVLTFYVQLTSFFHFSYLFLSGVLFYRPLTLFIIAYTTVYVKGQITFFCDFCKENRAPFDARPPYSALWISRSALPITRKTCCSEYARL
nr:MAG TPA: hypothetical protein [Caudoviricetes sp.]